MSTTAASTTYAGPTYLIRGKAFHFGFDHPYSFQDASGQAVLFARLKAFKLKEDLPICQDEAMTREILRIKARRIIDFGATYDVLESSTGQRLGSMRRKGIKSLARDEWAILNFDDQEVGKIEEDSWLLALVRRMVWSWMPQKYHATYGQDPVALYNRHMNPFVVKMTLELMPGAGSKVDTRLLLAAGLLLCAIEGGQR